jgi:hypothetical protein
MDVLNEKNPDNWNTGTTGKPYNDREDGTFRKPEKPEGPE